MSNSRRRNDRRLLTRTLTELLVQCAGLTRSRAETVAAHMAPQLLGSGWLRQHDDQTASRRPTANH